MLYSHSLDSQTLWELDFHRNATFCQAIMLHENFRDGGVSLLERVEQEQLPQPRFLDEMAAYLATVNHQQLRVVYSMFETLLKTQQSCRH